MSHIHKFYFFTNSANHLTVYIAMMTGGSADGWLVPHVHHCREWKPTDFIRGPQRMRGNSRDTWWEQVHQREHAPTTGRALKGNSRGLPPQCHGPGIWWLHQESYSQRPGQCCKMCAHVCACYMQADVNLPIFKLQNFFTENILFKLIFPAAAVVENPNWRVGMYGRIRNVSLKS